MITLADPRVDGLERALEHAGGTHTVPDVLEAVERGRAQIWASDESVVITEIRVSPQRKILNIWLAAGELNDVIALADRAVDWARAQGCTAATIQGRKGWERLGEPLGWHHQATVIAREI